MAVSTTLTVIYILGVVRTVAHTGILCEHRLQFLCTTTGLGSIYSTHKLVGGCHTIIDLDNSMYARISMLNSDVPG